MKGTERIVAVIDAIPELHLVGRPEMCLVAVGSDSLDVFRLCDAMQALGWHMYPQLKVGELRETFHLTVLPWNVDQLDAWEADLRACVAQVKESTASSQLDELRKAIHQLELEGLSTEQIEGLLGMAGLGGGGAPEGMAELPETVMDLNDNMEALAATVEDVNEQLTNVPSGFKIALARFQATEVDGDELPGGVGNTFNIAVSDVSELDRKLQERNAYAGMVQNGTPLTGSLEFAVDRRGS